MKEYQLTLAAELASLSKFRKFIQESLADQPRVKKDVVYDLQLAMDEASTNIITHGYANMNPGSIILKLRPELEQVVMTITDFGHPFEPSDVPAPDLEAGLKDEPMGGFGLFIIYRTIDEVNYKSTAFGNDLILMKYLVSDE